MPFVAEEVAITLIEVLRPLMVQPARQDRDLADQIKRAASSAALNAGEGRRREGRDRVHHFRILNGSAAEVHTALRVAVAWGYFEPRAVAQALRLVDRLVAMTWRLGHPAAAPGVTEPAAKTPPGRFLAPPPPVC